MQPLFLRRISVVHVYVHIATTTPDPAGQDLRQLPSPPAFQDRDYVAAGEY